MEEFREKILEAFGYTTEELNCANVETALSEIFDNDFYKSEINFLETFITNCSTEKFEELKKFYV